MNDEAVDDALVREARRFLQERRTLVLATAAASGEPDASYAPFVRDAGDAFCVYLSRLARHTANLSASRRASVLLIEDEGAARELFARRRLTFACRVSLVERGSRRWEETLDRFERKFGEVVATIRPLEDFVLFRLEPEAATYVGGFARAARFAGSAVERLLGDAGE